MEKPLFVGLIAWLTLTIVVSFIFPSSIENDLEQQSKLPFKAVGSEGIEVSVSGRDLMVTSTVQSEFDRTIVLTLSSSIYGVQTIVEAITVNDSKSNATSKNNTIENSVEHTSSLDNDDWHNETMRLADNDLDQDQEAVDGTFNKTESLEDLAGPTELVSHNINCKEKTISNQCDSDRIDAMFPLSMYFDSAKYETDCSMKKELEVVYQTAKRCPHFNFNDSRLGRAENRRLEFNIITAGIL